MRLITPDGMAEELVGEVSKAELMSGEARDFARYIREPEHTRAAYDGDTRLASQLVSWRYGIWKPGKYSTITILRIRTVIRKN